MPDPENQPIDPNGAPSATDEGHQAGIVDDLPSWKRALESIADPSLKEALNKKLEGYERKFSEKMMGLSKREQEIVHLAETLKQAQTAPPQGTASVKAEGRKVLDALMEQATDPSAREGIRQLREAIREETDIEKLKETVARLERTLQDREVSSQVVRKQTVAKDIKSLEEMYGDELIDKYREQVEAYSIKHPEHSPRKWLHSLADPDELDQALRIHQKRKDTKPNGESEAPKKRDSAPVTSTKPSPIADQYKGKGDKSSNGGSSAGGRRGKGVPINWNDCAPLTGLDDLTTHDVTMSYDTYGRPMLIPAGPMPIGGLPSRSGPQATRATWTPPMSGTV